MKKLLPFTAILLFITTANFAQWTNTNYYTSDIGNNGVFQIIEKENILFAATSQGVFKSENNGELWKVASKGLPETRFQCIEKYKSNLIALREPQDKPIGFYISSTNGETWQHKITNIEEPIELMEAKNDSLFAGTQKGIYYSTDGGNIWKKSITSLAIIQENSVGDFEFIGNNIFAATKVGLLKSADGGLNWVKVAKSAPCTKLFYTKGSLYVSANSRLMVTKDLGSTISTISSNVNQFPINSFGTFLNDELIVENDTIYYGVPNYLGYSNPVGLHISTDNGLTWQKKWDNPLNVAGAVCFYKNKNAWFQGTLFGGIYKSTDLGANWRLSSKGMVSQTTVPNNYCDLLLPNPFDTRYQTKSLDDGNTWSLLSPTITDLIFKGCYFNKYFALSSENGIQVSTDGTSWSGSGEGIPFGGKINFLRYFEIENNTIYAYTKVFDVYKSVDEGKSYTFAFKEPKGNSKTYITPQTFTWGKTIFSTVTDSLNSPYYKSSINNAGDATWSVASSTFEGVSSFNTSSNGGQSWNKPTGLPSQFVRTTVNKNGNQIVIFGYELFTELADKVFNSSTGLYTTQVIQKPIFKIFNSIDFGVSFKEVKIQGIVAGNMEYQGDLALNNNFCSINITSNQPPYVRYIQKLYSLDKGLTWKDPELIAPTLKIRNIVKYKNSYYLASDSLGLWESANEGINWKRNSSLNADYSIDLKELNGILFCHHNKGLYYLKDNQWKNIGIDELPSSIYQIGATATSLFVTTFRDGIWKYPMANILSTTEETVESILTKVYPNPSNDIVNIDFGQVGSYNIKLLTYTGTELQSFKTANINNTRLSVKGLPQGLYFLKIEKEGKISYQKIMVQQ